MYYHASSVKGIKRNMKQQSNIPNTDILLKISLE